MNAIVKATSAQSMTSFEIAELVETEHRNVKLSIERLMKKGVIQQSSMTNVEKINNLGHKITVGMYAFKGEQGKRDSIIVVAQLCPEFTARLVDRWQELENQIQQPKALSRMDLIQIALEAEQENIVLRGQVEFLEPKAEALEAIAGTEHNYTLRECAKTIGIKEKDLIQLLLTKKWIYRDCSTQKLQPYADKVEKQHIFINRASPVITNTQDGKERVFLHMRVTAFGLTRITGLVNKSGLVKVVIA
ncbi:MAG: DNA-binding protein [Moraxellaceae bacterium]|nr:MAG: DNA-binding protein [Moraxellaceae bacterium]